jgi:hypothetical protein
MEKLNHLYTVIQVTLEQIYIYKFLIKINHSGGLLLF